MGLPAERVQLLKAADVAGLKSPSAEACIHKTGEINAHDNPFDEQPDGET
jgi:hypothetical protein